MKKLFEDKKNQSPNTSTDQTAQSQPGNARSRKPSAMEITTAVCATFALGWILIGQQGNVSEAGQSNFMGGSPRVENSDAINTLRLLFPAGVRSNWHSHSWGQLLMVEEGRGLTQDRDGPLLEKNPGDAWFTKGGVEHWHGAAPDEDVLQLTIYEGDVNWLEGVSDEVYTATPQAQN